MRKIWLFISLLLFVLCAQAVDAPKSNDFIAKLINQQLNKSVALDKSITAILARYPEKVDVVLYTAFKLYPLRYKEVIKGAVSAEPVLSCSVIDVALKSHVAEVDELLGLVIASEPAYAQDIINTALEHHPVDIESIIRIAISTEPQIATDVVPTTFKAHPDKTVDILTGAIQGLPSLFIFFTDTAMTLFPGKHRLIMKTALRNAPKNIEDDLISLAIRHGMNEKAVKKRVKQYMNQKG